VRARALVFALVLALVLAIPTPARAAPEVLSPPIWSRTLPGGPRSLAVDSTGAVVTTDSGHVRALDERGKTRWQTKVHDGDVSRGAPAIDHDLVLVGVPSRVVALSRHDGAIRWERPMDPGAEVTSLALGGSFAIAGDDAGTLRAFDASDGAVRWSVHYEGDQFSASRIDVAASVVIAIWHEPPSPTTRAFDLATGALRWEAMADLFSAAPVISGGRAFVAIGDGKFSAAVGRYNLVSGDVDWVVIMPASFEPSIVPAIDDHDFVIIDRIGQVTAIDPVSGAPRWTRGLRQRVMHAQVVLLPRRVVVTTFSGELFVLDRVSGRVVAHTDAQRLNGLPAATARIGSGSRMLIAYRLTQPGRLEMRRVR
jgi:outer membrane protein assembly factor BamB